MYAYRVLNDYDIKLKPQENGLFGKQIIEENIEDSFNLLKNYTDSSKSVYTDSLLEEKSELATIPHNTANIFKDGKRKLSDITSIIDTLPNYPIEIESIINFFNNHQSDYKEIMKYIEENKYATHNFLNEFLENYPFNYSKDLLIFLNLEPESQLIKICNLIFNYMHIYQSINTHLLKGSTKAKNWISFTNNFDKLNDFYLNQSYHEIAIIDSNITNGRDKELIGLDLSDENKVNEAASFLITKNGLKTNQTCMAFNYSKSMNEIIYYAHIPPERIITTLGALEYDLMYNGLFNIDLINSKSMHMRTLIYELQKKLHEDGRDNLIGLFEKLYIRNMSIKKLIDGNMTKEELLKAKEIILSYIQTAHNSIIMPKPFQKIKLPESSSFNTY